MTASFRLTRALAPCAAVLLLAGCGPEAPSDAKPGAERKPTAAEIRAQFDSVLQPVYAIVAACTADTRIPSELAAQVQTQLDER